VKGELNRKQAERNRENEIGVSRDWAIGEVE